MVVTPEQQNLILNEEQKTVAWKNYRVNRATGSLFAALAGIKAGTSLNRAVKEYLWPKDISRFQDVLRGIINEKVASAVFEKFLKGLFGEDAKVHFIGFAVSLEYPYLGVSVDGFIEIKGRRYNLEIKCPRKHHAFLSQEYYAQTQGSCGLLGLEGCFFVSWTTESTVIKYFPFNPNYWWKCLFPNLKRNYFKEILPRLAMKKKGLILEDCLNPVGMPEVKQLKRTSKLRKH